jgi:hypothetical protein
MTPLKYMKKARETKHPMMGKRVDDNGEEDQHEDHRPRPQRTKEGKMQR